MRVMLVSRKRAFLPEVTAYANHLKRNGFEYAHIDQISELAHEDFDATIVFLGFLGYWNKFEKPLVRDFASRSTRTPRRARDLVRRQLGKEADLGVYQSAYVKHGSPHSSEYTFRDMGYFQEFVQPRKDNPRWDLVYVGETRRQGVFQVLKRFCSWGMSVAVAGPEARFPDGVEYLGVLDFQETYEVLSDAYFGLNAIPEKEPYSHQFSTKLVEYSALGLNIISSRGPWVENFVNQRDGRVLWLNEVRSPRDLIRIDLKAPFVGDLDWEAVLTRAGVVAWLKQFIDAQDFPN